MGQIDGNLLVNFFFIWARYYSYVDPFGLNFVKSLEHFWRDNSSCWSESLVDVKQNKYFFSWVHYFFNFF